MRGAPGVAVRRALARLALAVAVAGAAACSRGDGPAPTPSASAAPLEETPLPAPAGHLADFTLITPDATWRALRELVGGPVALLPGSFALMAGTALGLDAATSAELSGDVPVVGALGADSAPAGETLGLVVAVHTRSGAELEARLTRGADARYTAERDAGSGIVVLAPKGAATRDLVLGVRGNYVLAGSSRAVLLGLGPYVARTLTKRPTTGTPPVAFSLEASEAALSGELARRLRARWKELSTSLVAADLLKRTAAGRAPDFGEPAAAVAAAESRVERLAAVLESSRGFRLTAQPAGARLDVRAWVDPAGGAAAEVARTLAVGSPKALGRLPASTLVGYWSRSTQPERGADATALVEGLGKLFGERFKGKDRERVGQWLSSLALGRGDEVTFGLVMDGREGVLFGRTPLADQKALDAGLRGLFSAHKIPALAAPLEGHVGKPTVKLHSATIEGVGKVARATVTLRPPGDGPGKPPPAPRTVEAYWVEHAGELLLVAGEKPDAVLQRAAGPGPFLGGDPEFGKFLDGFGSGVGSALVVRVGVLLPPGNAAGLPSVLAGGSEGGRLWARADLGKDFLGLVARAAFRGGF